ncbi:MAG TPA: hypothetical protein VHI13_05940 [Candidatus Kapabacteria bacterium]|nr:hypothetical protein [Candidatus Kapabacteria bacterium]
MNTSDWIDRLRDDESLTGELPDDVAARLLAWGEQRLAACATEEEARAVFADVRAVARAAGRGEELDGLLAGRDQHRGGSVEEPGKRAGGSAHADATEGEKE